MLLTTTERKTRESDFEKASRDLENFRSILTSAKSWIETCPATSQGLAIVLSSITYRMGAAGFGSPTVERLASLFDFVMDCLDDDEREAAYDLMREFLVEEADAHCIRQYGHLDIDVLGNLKE